MYHSKIVGLGHYVPENIVTNDHLSEIIDTNDAWIQERTGIQERRHVIKGSGETTTTMGVKAAKMAIENAGTLKGEAVCVETLSILPLIFKESIYRSCSKIC